MPPLKKVFQRIKRFFQPDAPITPVVLPLAANAPPVLPDLNLPTLNWEHHYLPPITTTAHKMELKRRLAAKFNLLDLAHCRIHARTDDIRTSTRQWVLATTPAKQTFDGEILEEEEIFRVKNIKYGNVSALAEFLSSAFHRAMGLPGPELRIATNGITIDNFNFRTRNDFELGREPDSYMCIASKMIPDFRDVGAVLLDRNLMRRLVELEKGPQGVTDYNRYLGKYQRAATDARNITDNVLRQVPNFRKMSALHKMYALLPKALQKEVTVQYYGSKIFGNWDFANHDLFNIGFTGLAAVSQSQNPTELKTHLMNVRAAFVDFGNSGPIGFRGGWKEDSRANALGRSRLDDPYVTDETIFRAENATFNSSLGHTIFGISDLPRNAPFARIFRDESINEREFAVQSTMPRSTGQTAQTSLDVQQTHKLSPSARLLMDASLELAFRLSCVPARTFERITRRFWIAGTHDWFAFKDSTNPNNPTPQRIAQTMEGRRRNFLNHFSASDIASWEERNPQRAKLARDEVIYGIAAVLKEPTFIVEDAVNRSRMRVTQQNRRRGKSF